MNLLNAHLVDEIRKHPSGQVDLIGLYEDIYLETVPSILENIQIFLDLGLENNDKGQKHTVDVSLTHHSTEIGKPLRVNFSVPNALDFPRNTAQLDLAFFDVAFPSYGEYAIEVRIDGVLQRLLPLFVLPQN
jgi:hypothetical protein